MTKRAKSIRDLLDRVDRDLKNLEADYQKSLSTKAISADLRIDIKNICGNLRSVLDYLAKDIRETCCPGANPQDRFYFPIFSKPQEYQSQAAKWYPDLQTKNPNAWSYLESVQPYQSAFAWLGQLNQINNENKHDDLVEQTRVDTPRVTVNTPGGGSVSWDPRGVRFGSGVFIGGVPIDPRTQLPVPHPSQTVERVVWIDFRFGDPDVSVLQLLRDSVAGIRKIATELEMLL